MHGVAAPPPAKAGPGIAVREPLRATMWSVNSIPLVRKLSLKHINLTQLPPEARQRGSAAFKDAVVAHVTAHHAAKGEAVVVAVDDENAQVLQVPAGATPLNTVVALLRSGQLAQAVPFLEAMVKREPVDAQTLYNLGLTYSELRQYDEAIIRLKRVVQLEPAHSHAWTAIGVAYQRMGKPQHALEPLRQAVLADPRDGYARRNLGAMLLSTGERDAALEHLRVAHSVLPNDPQTVYGLATVLQAGSAPPEKDLEEADRLYRALIDRWPSDPVAELARMERTKLAQKSMRARGGGVRMDAVMYLLGAFDTFDRLGPARSRELTTEVAMQGRGGLDINDSAQKYTLRSLPGQFSGLHLLCLLFAGMKALDPNLETGIDLQLEYDLALGLRGKSQPDGVAP